MSPFPGNLFFSKPSKSNRPHWELNELNRAFAVHVFFYKKPRIWASTEVSYLGASMGLSDAFALLLHVAISQWV